MATGVETRPSSRGIRRDDLFSVVDRSDLFLPWWLLPLVVAGAVVAWIGLIFATDRVRFVAAASPAGATGVEAASALASLFAALVLALFPDDRIAPRLRWVAGGFVVLGLGAVGLGALGASFGAGDLASSLYAFLTVWTMAGGCFVAGLVPRRPLRLDAGLSLIGLGALVALVGVVVATADRLPTLVRVTDLDETVSGDRVTLPGLTAWHWGLSLVPLAVALVALVGAARQFPAGALRSWLVVALVLLAGAQVHALFWPSAYRPLLTTSNVLRLGFSVVVAAGGILEMRRLAAERAERLARAEETARRLRERAALQADFGAMVAHELSSPIAALRAVGAVLRTGELDRATRVEVAATIRTETDLLNALVADVRDAAAVERDDFTPYPFAVPLAMLLADAAAFARALPGDHPFGCSLSVRERVVADPERIAQVLHNLLANAAKYSPPGAPIELRTTRVGDRVRVEVVDRGYGIDPADLPQIFEKFGRGHDARERRVPGAGLGLYLSRRIVRAHGSDLYVESIPGRGSVFWFELGVAR
jgi:signal transduction histidine kinase